MLGVIIGSAIGAAIASPDMEKVHETVKNLETRITSTLKTIKGELDIIKALQILTIYGAKKDNLGNIVYTAEDNSKIEYNIKNNDIRCYLSTGELYSINGEPQIIFKKIQANDGGIFNIGFYNSYVVIIGKDGKAIEIPNSLPRDEHPFKVHWWNKKKRYTYLKELRKKRIACRNEVKVFLSEYPEIIPYYDKWIGNIKNIYGFDALYLVANWNIYWRVIQFHRPKYCGVSFDYASPLSQYLYISK